MSTAFLTMKQLRDAVGTENTIRQWIRVGLLPAGKSKKVGRAWMQIWSAADVEQALQNRELGEERLRDAAARQGGRGRSGQLPLDEVARAAMVEVCHV